jgi:hypothetical protein
MNIDGSVTARLAQQGVAYAPQIAGAAQSHGLDPELLAAVAAQETGGPGTNAGRNIVGDSGHGRGLFQIDDRWHDFAKSAEAMDPTENADYAAGMISGLLKRYGGNVREALSAYNAGDPHATGTLTTWCDGTTLGYADSVLRHYAKLTGAPSPVEPTEVARAEGPAESERVNALLAMTGAVSPRVPTLHHHQFSAPWRTTTTTDATGHSTKSTTSYASYIDGDDDS